MHREWIFTKFGTNRGGHNQSEKFCSGVNKDWTCKDKDKDKDQAYKDKDYTCKDKNKDLTDKDQNSTYSYLYCTLQLNLYNRYQATTMNTK